MTKRIRNIGRFWISMELLETKPDIAREILKDCIVLRAEAQLHLRAVEYFAEHDSFPEETPGAQHPQFTCQVYTAPLGKEFAKQTPVDHVWSEVAFASPITDDNVSQLTPGVTS